MFVSIFTKHERPLFEARRRLGVLLMSTADEHKDKAETLPVRLRGRHRWFIFRRGGCRYS